MRHRRLKDSPGYWAIHKWIRGNRNKPEACEICNVNPPSEVALVKGIHERNINNYLWVCHKCHTSYDNIGKNLGAYVSGKSKMENPNWRGGRQKYKCVTCGSITLRWSSTVRNKSRVFCSPLCCGKYFSTTFSGKGNPNYRHGRYVLYGKVKG